MLFQILKKDMLKRKGINIILFIFITLSTVFLASSVNNILVVSSAVNYYMDYANIPDSTFISSSLKQKSEISEWLSELKENKKITTYDIDEQVIISIKALEMKKDGIYRSFKDNGASQYGGKIPKNHSKVYDTKGNPFTLAKGEVAIPVSLADDNALKVGDMISITNKNIRKEYHIKVIMKDAAFGNQMAGMTRFIFSDEDYQDIRSDKQKILLYNVECENGATFTNELNTKEFDSIMIIVSRDMYTLMYSFDMITAALLILIGICLILIAFLVLRFTLVFTMEEQYQEIGMLKAIGLRNVVIKKLYLIKYFLIVLLGSSLGFFLSIPISSIMVNNVSHNMIMAKSNTNLGVNLLSAVVIVLAVLSFCYFCTRKLNKVSVITAIRGGDTGERFTGRKGVALHSKKRIRVPFYLGYNDILSHVRRYAVLVVTFCISFLLISIPLNTVNTMRSEEMVNKFALDPSSNTYVKRVEVGKDTIYKSKKEIADRMKGLEKELAEKGYDASVKANIIYFIKFTGEDPTQKLTIMTLQGVNNTKNYLRYTEGNAPLEENEIAISQAVMEQQGWKIGDYIHATINGKQREMIISGTYSDYMQLGKSARLNPKINTEKELMNDYWAIMVSTKTDKTQADFTTEMKQQFPNYEWYTVQQLVDVNVGGIQDILAQMLIPITGMLCFVIMLITLLMEKLFITREKGEIAMMKSIGFRNRSIRLWQVIRMISVAGLSMLISIPLSFLSNQFVLRPIFKIMGADVTIQVEPFQVYILYPMVLLAGIILATILATRAVKCIDIREINNIE